MNLEKNKKMGIGKNKTKIYLFEKIIGGEIMQEENSLPKPQKSLKGKIISSAIFGALSIILFILYLVMGNGAISLKTGETEGWEGLGVAVALIVIVAIMLVAFVLIHIFDIIYLAVSISLLSRTRKTKSKSKIYAIISTALSSIILVVSWIILLVFLMAKNG